jgi:hypothetical protein
MRVLFNKNQSRLQNQKNSHKTKTPECEIHLKNMRLILQEITNHIRT